MNVISVLSVSTDDFKLRHWWSHLWGLFAPHSMFYALKYHRTLSPLFSLSLVLFLTLMSRASTPPPAEPAISLNVVVEMAYYERSQPATRGKGKGQQKKLPPKIKDFEASITRSKDSWLSFLKEILRCHDETRFRVSARRPYGIKVLIPPEKAK